VAITELQGRLDALVTATPAPEPEAEQFSPFREDHLERSARLAGELIATAEARGPEAAMDEAESSDEIPGIVKHAVKLMVTHSARARRELAVPAVEILASDAAPVADAAPSVPAQDVIPVPNPNTQPATERALDWYRQDPRANDHHSHWHIVYPGRPPVGQLAQKRQGELFLYMHQQMMARYATERLVAGLSPVVPFDPVPGAAGESYTQPIAEGYGLPGYTTRGSGATLHDIQNAPPDNLSIELRALAIAHGSLVQAVADQTVELRNGGTHALTPALLGAAMEASQARDPDANQALPLANRYRSLHNNGHVLTAEVIPPAPSAFPGVMYYFETAISDPFFYRWHGHIDNQYASYQATTGANEYDRFAAKVRFRGHDDIALVPSSAVDAPDGDFSGWASQTFGQDPASFGAPATDELVTRFLASRVTIPWADGTTVEGAMLLAHDPFVTVLRIESVPAASQKVTVRLFLAHADVAGDRRRWIELDKFHAVLEPGVNLVAQPDARSSVIKRKGVDAPGALPEAAAGTSGWCDCGWPYGLLIPSGASTPQGSPFKLMAAVTDHALDHANDANSCGSMSFCGAEDEYPDARAMGYPFDKPFPGDDPLATIAAHDTMTVRNLTIRCANPHPQ
jgi:tyrosinase